MSTEKRLVLFVILSLTMLWGMPLIMKRAGLLPPQPRRVAPAGPKGAEAGKAQPPPAAATEQPPEARAKGADDAAEAEAQPEPPKVSLAQPEELVLGSASRQASNPFKLELRLDQRGAGVAQLLSSHWEAEIVEGKPRNRPLELIRSDPTVPPSFALTLIRNSPPDGTDPDAPEKAAAEGSPLVEPLDAILWEVERDKQGRAVTPVFREDEATKARVEGQQVTFVARVEQPSPLTVARTYRLWPGEDGFEMDLTIRSEEGPQVVSYELAGPHGIPIEGEWYTGTFRDVFFGGVSGSGTQVTTLAAYNIAKKPEEPERYTTLPVHYVGVENQYFAVLVEPVPAPSSPEESRIAEARTALIHADPKDIQKSDVSVELISKPITVSPDLPARHAYKVFAGPKTYDALRPYGASDLSTYRKGWWLPVLGDLGASFMAKQVIAPMLDVIYAGTSRLARVFGGTRGSYGIAIILLTVAVRLILFPLGRKQARMAKKMQDLQPLLVKLKEECGDDKEKLTKETFALYKQYGVNPMGGCLPALIQLPVLIGLWQALNNSVALRHSSFLWIRNLAAPDQLFKFPFDMTSVPLIGWAIGPYFNVLPIVVVILMLVQTKLFSPPPTTPEAEQQQKMMKFMMIFMAFMFYKVPSGLGIYFITSSLWQIGERLLLPKGDGLVAKPAGETPGAELPEPRAARNAAPAGRGGNTAKAQPAARRGWWAQVRAQAQERIEKIMEEAAKDSTHRKDEDARRPAPPPARDRDRDRRNPRNGRKRP
jgi:YidC/Oxa1 family membrane protein insertase